MSNDDFDRDRRAHVGFVKAFVIPVVVPVVIGMGASYITTSIRLGTVEAKQFSYDTSQKSMAVSVTANQSDIGVLKAINLSQDETINRIYDKLNRIEDILLSRD